jgi:GTP-binding protein
LLRVFLLIDARHGSKAADGEIMSLLDGAAVSYQVVLTKTDKISQTALTDVMARTLKAISKHPAAYPSIIATSAETGWGFEELRATIAKLITAHGT